MVIKKCKSCILPENYASIKINSSGICNFCESHKPIKYLSDTKLKDRILNYRKYDRRLSNYDCIIGLSGGRDSTYLLWYFVTVLNLNPLAVFINSGLIPEQTIGNITKTVSKLNIDLVTLNHNYLKKSFRYHMNAWLKRPVPETLITLCVGCRLGMKKLMFNEAVKQSIPVIITGGTPFEGKHYKTNILKKTDGGIKSLISGYLKQVILNPSIISNMYCLKTQINEFYYTYFGIKQKLRSKNILHFSPYYRYIRWNEKHIESVLVDELDWKKHPKSDSYYRGDCEVGLIRQHLYYKTLGYNDKDDHLSCLIRDKQISRKSALRRVEQERIIPENHLTTILSEMGIEYSKVKDKIDT